jgi:GntR family transcriptional regulator, rspAB operon transcriptional repressor
MPNTRRRRSLADEVYDRLRHMIVTLQLRPGAVLSEKELCARYAVSRTPVREAILRLADHGLVVIAPQHATFVSGIDPDAVRQAHFLRINLEVPVVLRLCDAETLDLGLPRSLVVEQQVLLARDDFEAFLPLDDQFHAALFALAGVGDLWSAIQARKAHLDRIRFLQAPEGGKLALLVREHAAILDAIVRHDRSEAESVARTHVSGAVAYMEQLLARRPELFASTASVTARRAQVRTAT